jgi:hypothetical protein
MISEPLQFSCIEPRKSHIQPDVRGRQKGARLREM